MQNVAVPHVQGAMVRLLPPPVAGVGSHRDGGANPITVNGRTYSCALGSVITVPAADAAQMTCNGWTQVCDFTGTTANRPANAARGSTYDDTTVGKAIFFDGVTWRDKAGAAV
jgi:hypothetical protein